MRKSPVFCHCSSVDSRRKAYFSGNVTGCKKRQQQQLKAITWWSPFLKFLLIKKCTMQSFGSPLCADKWEMERERWNCNLCFSGLMMKYTPNGSSSHGWFWPWLWKSYWKKSNYRPSRSEEMLETKSCESTMDLLNSGCRPGSTTGSKSPLWQASCSPSSQSLWLNLISCVTYTHHLYRTSVHWILSPTLLQTVMDKILIAN